MRKNVLITGASGAIGSATALEFAKAGCNLFLVCNSRINELDEFADKLSSSYDIEVFTASIDFSDTSKSKDDSIVVKATDEKTFKMWQYTNSGVIDGITGNVDINVMFN